MRFIVGQRVIGRTKLSRVAPKQANAMRDTKKPFFHTSSGSRALGSRPFVKVNLDVPERLLLAAQSGLPFMADASKPKISSWQTLGSMVAVAVSIALLASAHTVGGGADIVLYSRTVIVTSAERLEAARHARPVGKAQAGL
jgi:hypothetical protein